MSYEERASEIKGTRPLYEILCVLILSKFSSAKFLERDNHIRESWVKAMELRLVREELEKCQQGEGVNHYENCKWMSEKYLTMLRTNKVHKLTRYLPVLGLTTQLIR
jgi:hypothetical protein